MNNNKLHTNRLWTRWDTSKEGRAARKKNRKIIKAVRHKLLMHVPLTDDEKKIVVRERITAGCGIDYVGNVRHSIMMQTRHAEDFGIDTTGMTAKEIYNALPVVEGMEYIIEDFEGFEGCEGCPSCENDKFQYMEKAVEMSDDRIVVAMCRHSETGCNFLMIDEYIDNYDLKPNKIRY